VQLYRCFVSQSSEVCRHNPLCCFSASVFCCCLFRYRLSPETFGYSLVRLVADLTRHLNMLNFHMFLKQVKRSKVTLFWSLTNCHTMKKYPVLN